MIKLYLFDIEGTTTDINFVHKVLFPYSETAMDDYVRAHHGDEEIKVSIDSVRRTVREEEKKELDLAGVIEKLKSWIKEDRKHPALKEIQGHIWDKGYVNNHFKGHVYPDVLPLFRKIVESGSKVAIYSSGSVHAQKLIFGYSEAGDLTPFISAYFDTKVGAKREVNSYQNIAQELRLHPKEIHFFSDIKEELKAAQDAGLQVTLVMRSGGEDSEYNSVTDFRRLLELV